MSVKLVTVKLTDPETLEAEFDDGNVYEFKKTRILAKSIPIGWLSLTEFAEKYELTEESARKLVSSGVVSETSYIHGRLYIRDE